MVFARLEGKQMSQILTGTQVTPSEVEHLSHMFMVLWIHLFVMCWFQSFALFFFFPYWAVCFSLSV